DTFHETRQVHNKGSGGPSRGPIPRGTAWEPGARAGASSVDSDFAGRRGSSPSFTETRKQPFDTAQSRRGTDGETPESFRCRRRSLHLTPFENHSGSGP